MEPLLTHLPHLGLAIVATVLFVWMERAEKRARLAVATGEVGEDHDETFGGPRGTQALGMAIGVAFGLSVLGLVLLEMVDERPGWSLVFTYLIAGAIAATWAAWSTPRRLPADLRRRLGKFGTGLVGGVIGAVFLWGVVFAGMLLSQGVVLPSAH